MLILDILIGFCILAIATVFAVLLMGAIVYCYYVHETKKYHHHHYEYASYDEFFMYLEAWALYDDTAIRLLDPLDSNSPILLINTSDEKHYYTEGELSIYEISICSHHLILGPISWVKYYFWRNEYAITLKEDYLKRELREEMRHEKSCQD